MRITHPSGRLLGHLFGLFFSGPRDTKKGGPGGPSKIVPFFGRFWGLPGGPQEGSRLHGSSIFTFAARPKKGSKMGAKMKRFGLPNLSYTHFGPPFVRQRCQQNCGNQHNLHSFVPPPPDWPKKALEGLPGWILGSFWPDKLEKFVQIGAEYGYSL